MDGWKLYWASAAFGIFSLIGFAAIDHIFKTHDPNNWPASIGFSCLYAICFKKP